jgi:F-type H+-transporting ATPase subunit epsilon
MQSYFVDGGFVQVKHEVVSLLTDRAQPAKTLDPKQAENELQVALQRRPTSDLEFVEKEKEMIRARRKLALAREVH